jgi:hypothetical protein
MCPFIKSAYINLTVKEPNAVSFHIKKYVVLVQYLEEHPLTHQPPKRFFGELYNCLARGRSPNHTSSKNRVFFMIPYLKEPLEKNSSFTPMRPFQNGESVGLVVTCDKVFFL